MDFSSLLVDELYTDQVSYFPEDDVKIYTSTNSWFSFNKKINVSDFSGNIVDEIDIKIAHQNQISNNVLKDGLGYTHFYNYQLPNNIHPGIYLINNKVPLIVKSRKHSEITIVYPYINNILYQAINDKTVFSENTPKASFLRSVSIDKYSEGMASFFSYLNTIYQVNYITDVDLEERKNINNSKLLIIYGKSTFWTPKMKLTFENYIAKGGNLLNITSYFANDICWYNNTQEIELHNTSGVISSWRKYDSLNTVNLSGTSYSYSGYSDDKSYKIVNANHPLFKNVMNQEINVPAHLFSAPPIKWYNELPRIDLDSMGFYKGEILAYSKAAYNNEDKGIKGVFILQPASTSGKIISLGTEDWCLKENIGENKQLQLITKNAVEYLLQ